MLSKKPNTCIWRVKNGVQILGQTYFVGDCPGFSDKAMENYRLIHQIFFEKFNIFYFHLRAANLIAHFSSAHYYKIEYFDPFFILLESDTNGFFGKIE
jgi:hypothetical protein